MNHNTLPPPLIEYAERNPPPCTVDDLPAWGHRTAYEVADIVDATIAPLFLSAPSCSIYAVGGFGRREMSPFSDVDLLIIAPEESDISNLTTSLWDTGLEPSIILRDTSSIKSSAKNDLMFATTILNARRIHGEPVEAIESAAQWLAQVQPDFAAQHKSEREDRWRRYKGAGCQEPDVRSGPGGLRDFQMLRWTNMLRDEDLAEMLPAFHTILAARHALHFSHRSREDRLLISDHGSIRDWLGWEDLNEFLRRTLLSMKRIKYFIESPRIRSLPIRPIDIREFLSSPKGRSVATFFRELDQSGELSNRIPEWKHVAGLIRPDKSHAFTPEEHTLRVIASVEEALGDKPMVVDPKNISRPDLLFLGALFHDIGKGSGRDHSEAGEEIALRVMTEWGYSPSDAGMVAWLVRSHLYLAANALRRDIDDPDLIHEVARHIGTVERLAMLYFLTVADIQSVGPGIFTDWKASLINTLTLRVARQCQTFLPPRLLAEHILDGHLQAVRMILGGDVPDGDIEDHFRQVDARYALTYGAERIAAHLKAIPRLTPEKWTVLKNDYERNGFIELTFLAQTRPGLFAELAGLLSARNLNILAADIFTRDDGIAIDSFKIECDRGSMYNLGEKWPEFQDECGKILGGEVSAMELLAAQERYAERSPSTSHEPKISIDNRTSQTDSIVEILFPDEMGLLYRIASAFRDCGIGISSAIVTTTGATAIDVFYVTTASGEKIDDDAIMELFQKRLTHRQQAAADAVKQGS